MELFTRFRQQIQGQMTTSLAWQMTSVGGVSLAVALVGLGTVMYGVVGHLLEHRWRSQVRQQLALAASLLDRGLTLGDDLLVVSVLGRLVSTPDVVDAMVLDRTGQVLAHHQPTERGKHLDDAFSQQCARITQLTFVVSTGGGKGGPYREVVTPLSTERSSTGVLRVTYRDPNKSLFQRGMWAFWWMLSGGIWLVGAWGCYRLGALIALPLRVTTQILPAPFALPEVGVQTSFGHSPIIGWFHQRNEVGEILQRVEPLRQRLARQQAETEATTARWARRLTAFLQTLGRQWPGGIVLTDGQHQVLFINDLAKERLCAGALVQEGQNLFDVFSHGECLDLFKQSLHAPNQCVQATFRDLPGPVTALHLSDDQLFGAFLLI
ncbi:MAG: hypothetical protein HYZ73_06680 [Elusimicrobia bacterium]|nr:hypothetical protein [Elusimicrobiota bacterium]